MVDPCFLFSVCSFEEYAAGGRVTVSRLKGGDLYLPWAFPLPLTGFCPW